MLLIRSLQREFASFSTSSRNTVQSIGQCKTCRELDQVLFTFATPLNASQTVHAIKRLKELACFNSHNALHTLVQRSESLEFTSRELSTMLHSIAKARLLPTIPVVFFHHLDRLDLPSFSSQDLSLTVWALAKLQPHSPNTLSFLNKVEAHVVLSDNGLNSFSPQGLSNLVWAFAVSSPRIKKDEFLPSVVSHLVKRTFSEFKPKELAMMVWSLAQFPRHSSSHVALMKAVYDNVKTRQLSTTFTNQELVTILLAWSKLVGGKDRALVVTMVKELKSRLKREEEWTLHLLCNLLSSLSRMQFCDVHVLEDAASIAMMFPANEFSPQQCAVLLFSLANLDFQKSAVKRVSLCERICSEIIHLVEKRRARFALQDWTMIVFALACLDVLHGVQVMRVFQLCPMVSPSEHSLAGAQQIRQAQLGWQQAHPGKVSALLMGLDVDAWTNAHIQSSGALLVSSSSLVHLSLAHQLKEYFSQVDTEVLLCHGAVSVDIYLPQENALVEVNGPHHYFYGGKQVNGVTWFKRRLLERQGYRVFWFPVEEFQQLRSAHEQHETIRKLVHCILRRGE